MKTQFKNNILAEPILGQQLICPDGLCTLLHVEHHGSGSTRLTVRINHSKIERWYQSTNVEYLNIPGRLQV